jgi:putative phosphoesterase
MAASLATGDGSMAVEIAGARKTIGVVSDTHGYLGGDVLHLFAGVDALIHAGDVGATSVLERLARIAPVTAVAGNIDIDGPAHDLPNEVYTQIAGIWVLVGHRVDRLEGLRDPAKDGVQLVVTGHTHRARSEVVDGVLYLNPGSAGAPRFGLSPSVALVTVTNGTPTAKIVPVG